MSEYNFVEGANPCPRCRENGRDKSGDNFFWYGDGQGGHCFSCSFTIPSEEFLNGDTIKKGDKVLITAKDTESLQSKSLTPEQLQKVHDKTVPRINVKYRGLDSDVCEELGVRWELDESGKPCAMYFPTKVQKDGEDVITGYKVRKFPKEFYSIGYVGKMNGLIGQNKAVAETLIVVGGEIDLITAIGALEHGDKYRKSYNVVTSPLGEDSTAQMIKLNYDWVDAHKKIIICMDNDVAGEQAFEKIQQVIDNDKLFKSNLRHKDLNDYLKAGDADKLPSDLYWNATAVKNFGISGSGDIFEEMLKSATLERVKLPPFLTDLNETFNGGIGLGEICNLVAPPSVGKTAVINQWILDWLMTSPYKIFVITLEDSLASYGMKIASKVAGVNIQALPTTEEKVEVLKKNKEAIDKYLYNEDMSHRFNIMDKIPSNIEDLKKSIVQAIKVYGSQIIVLDPLSALLASKSNEEQVDFMAFEESLKRDYNVTIINCLHVRKSGSGKMANSEGAEYSEEDIRGSSAIAGTATINILLNRNKMAEDEIERNTTTISISKNRTNGNTGKNLAKIYYSSTHYTLFSYSYAEKNNFFRGVSPERLKDIIDGNKASLLTSGDFEDELDESLEVF